MSKEDTLIYKDTVFSSIVQFIEKKLHREMSQDEIKLLDQHIDNLKAVGEYNPNYRDSNIEPVYSTPFKITLPGSIGIELFLTDYPQYHHRLKEYKFIGCSPVMIIECLELKQTCTRFVHTHYGVTVFLTKEEADNARENQKGSK